MGQLTSRSAKKIGQVDLASERKDFVKKCLDSISFANLPEEGRKEFIQFAKRKSPGDARRLEFWFSCPEEQTIEQLLKSFVTDGEDKLIDVREADKPEEILDKASSVDLYIATLKNRMKPELDNLFREFKRNLEDEIG